MTTEIVIMNGNMLGAGRQLVEKRRISSVWGGRAGVYVLLALSFVALVPGPTIAQHDRDQRPDIVFQPHRAVYDVTLARTSAGSSVAGLNGRMVYELTGNPCDGYTQKLRFVTETVNQDGDTQSNDLRSMSWESVQDPELRFDVRNFHDGVLAEASRGQAQRVDQPKEIRVWLRKPKFKVVALDEATRFPIAHAQAVLTAALEGKTIYPSVFFDGSETGEKSYHTTAVIGKKTPASPADKKDNDTLSPAEQANTSASWPIAMSYYSKVNNEGDGTPDFEMSYRFHLNGVTSKFLIDHGDFSFKGTLTKLEFLGAAGCIEEKT